MPTRKQRRREAKLRRHEWEEVYVDAEGREVAVEETEETARPVRNGNRPEKKRTAAPASARGVQPPSWNRVLRRAAIFAPLMFVTVHFLSPADVSTAQKVAQTAFLLLVFVPFSYVMDTVTYRLSQRRRAAAPKR
jgi:hypothetical protein